MFLRKITQEVAHPCPPEQAFDEVQQTLMRIGKLKSVDEATRTVKGSISVGGWVTLEVVVRPAEEGSVLAVIGRCDDVWGVGARRGIASLLGALPHSPGGASPSHQPAPAVARPPSPMDDLSRVQQFSVGLFLGLVSLCSLDVAWGRGLFPFAQKWLFVLAGVGGAITGLMVAQKRYRGAGLLAGAVTGLGAVGISVFLFRQMTTVYNIVAIATTLIGCLPGIVLFQVLRILQDQVFPPPGEKG